MAPHSPMIGEAPHQLGGTLVESRCRTSEKRDAVGVCRAVAAVLSLPASRRGRDAFRGESGRFHGCRTVLLHDTRGYCRSAA